MKLLTSVVEAEAISAAFSRPCLLSLIWKPFKESHWNRKGPVKTREIRFGMKNIDVMTNAINQPTALLQFMGSCVLRLAPSLQVSFNPATQTDRGDRRKSPNVSDAAIAIFTDLRDRCIKSPISDVSDTGDVIRRLGRLNLLRSASKIARCVTGSVEYELTLLNVFTVTQRKYKSKNIQ